MSRSSRGGADCSHEEAYATLIAEVPRKRGQVELTIGIDLGDDWSHYCTLNQQGEVIDRGRFRTKQRLRGRDEQDWPILAAALSLACGIHTNG